MTAHNFKAEAAKWLGTTWPLNKPLHVSLAALLAANDARARAERDSEINALRAKLNTPELHDFASGVVLEAAHQRERWGSEQDRGKTQSDWYWLIGYLAGKALYASLAGDTKKALHHVITTAAACANWHAALNGDNTAMRPGIEAPDDAPLPFDPAKETT